MFHSSERGSNAAFRSNPALIGKGKKEGRSKSPIIKRRGIDHFKQMLLFRKGKVAVRVPWERGEEGIGPSRCGALAGPRPGSTQSQRPRGSFSLQWGRRKAFIVGGDINLEKKARYLPAKRKRKSEILVQEEEKEENRGKNPLVGRGQKDDLAAQSSAFFRAGEVHFVRGGEGRKKKKKEGGEKY